MATFDELVQEYWTLSASTQDKATGARLNKVRELLGEEGARLATINKYGSAARTPPVVVPRRGAKGAPILDLLFELEDGRFVLVESKYGTAPLGRVQDRHVKLVSVSGGKVTMTPLPLKEQVEQLSPLWVKDRIAEIAKQDAALAKRLKEAVDQGQLLILEIRTTLNADGTLASDIAERTEDLKNWKGRRHTDAERRFARREALAAKDKRAAAKKARDARTAANKAKRDAEKAQGYANTAKKNYDKNPGVREDTKKRRWAQVAEKQRIADELKAKAQLAEAAAKGAKEAHAFTAELRELETKFREEARERLERTGATTGKSAATAATRAGEAARADTAVAGRMIENRLGGTAAGEKATLRGTAKKGMAIVKAAPKRAVLGIVQGARVVARVGTFAFRVLNFANPVFDLFLVVEIVDALVGWLRRDEIANAKEWKRLSEFFFGTAKTIRSTYGVEYETSIQGFINRRIETELASDTNDKNFLYWSEKWGTSSWRGFVYTQVAAEALERQEEKDGGEYGVKYYSDSGLQLSFTDAPQPNTRRETFVTNVGAQDKRNRSTLGQPIPYYQPEYNIEVKISQVNLRITHPVPTLTPFDFIIVRCRALMAEIVTFISQYDANLFPGQSVADEDVFGIEGHSVYWLEGYRFAAPVDTDRAHFCLKTLFDATVRLSEHASRGNTDFKTRNDNFTEGYFRRLKILRELGGPQGRYEGRRTIYEVGLRLLRLVTTDDDAVSELANVAFSIDDDLVRTLNECHKTNSREYNYQGTAPQ